MESTSPSGNASDPPDHRWAKIAGSAIALLTLTLPLLIVAYYSSNRSVDPLPQASYSLPQTGN